MTRLRCVSLLCAATLLLGCGNEKDIDGRLEALAAEREAYLARIEEVPDEALRDEAGKVARLLFWMLEAEIESEIPPETTEYAEDPLRIIGDYDDLDTLARQYATGLIATHDVRYRPQATEIELPFAYPFQNALSWHAAVLDDGTRLPVVDDGERIERFMLSAMASNGAGGGDAAADGEPGLVQQISPTSLKTLLREHYPNGEDAPPVQRLDGTLTLEIPRHVHRVSFGPGDVGRTRTVGDYRIRLESLDGHRAAVSVRDNGSDGPASTEWVERLDGRVILIARDASGRTLDDSGSATGTPGGPERILEVLDEAIEQARRGQPMDTEALQAELDARQRELLEEHDGAWFGSKTFHGTIAELDVALVDPVGGQTRELPLSLTPTYFEVPDNTRELAPFPSAATVYEHSFEALEGTVADEVDPGALDQAITITRDDYRDTGDDLAMVRFHYPDVVSNRLLRVFDRYGEVSELRFLDAEGQAIAMPADEDAREALYEFTIDRIEYHPGKFATPPARVTGRLEVRLLPTLHRRWVDAGSLPAGAELRDNAYFAPPQQDDRTLVFAQDRSGRYLRKLAVVDYGYDDAPSREAHYFYGRPARVLLLSADEAEQASYRFDVDLAR